MVVEVKAAVTARGDGYFQPQPAPKTAAGEAGGGWLLMIADRSASIVSAFVVGSSASPPSRIRRLESL
jgi:hypothetical protein